MVVYNEIQFYPIPDFEGYFISKCGTVLSTRPKNGKGPCKIEYARIMKTNVNRGGYKYLCLYKNKKQELKTVHRLVAMTFLEDFNVPGLTVDHKDNDKLNNNLDNLKMATMSEQCRNIKKRKGVCKVYDKRDNLWYWSAYWNDDEGKRKYKGFSVNIYGELFAYLLANDLRQAMVDKYYNRP
jgi:hypothetical protein